MLYRILLILSGILLILLGVGWYLNIAMMEDATGEFSTSTIRVCLLLSSLFLAVAGCAAILTGIFRYSKMLLFTNLIGMKLVTFPLLLLLGLVFSSQSAEFQPFLETLGSFLKLPAGIAEKTGWISVGALACIVWIFHSGITIAENGGELNGAIVTRVVTLLLFVFALLPVCYLLGMITIPAGISAFTLAAFVAWFMVLFVIARAKSKNNVVKLIFLTLVCVPLLAGYYYAVTFLYSIAGFIFEWKVIPLVLFVWALLYAGYNGKHTNKKIGISQCRNCGKIMKGWHAYCSTHCQNTANLKAAIGKVEKGGTIDFGNGNSITFE